MVACSLGLHTNVIELLTRAPEKIDLSLVNDNGDTALNRLARLGSRDYNDAWDLQTAEAILSRATKQAPAMLAQLIHLDNKAGFSPLLSACQGNKPNLISLFLFHGANPADKTGEGETAEQLCTRPSTKVPLRLVQWLARYGLSAQLAGLIGMYACGDPKPLHEPPLIPSPSLLS